MNYTGKWDSELTWYSPSATCLTLKNFLKSQELWLISWNISAVINCTFTFQTINVFGCFFGVMTQFDHEEYKYTIIGASGTTWWWLYKFTYIAHLSVHLSNHTWSEAMHKGSDNHGTTNHSGYIPLLELLCNIYTTN